ncbi:MAG: type VI secretion system tip protein VgrG [Lentisphaeraceae bacterium]|nr:type VI secretion system tip protein VgrG [Lentisphaeraceae bacterium]
MADTTPANGDTPDFDIEIDGTSVKTTYNVQSINITREINRIPYAKIAIEDGVASENDFPVSSEDFTQGSEIEIKFSYLSDTPETVFKGIIVSQRIKANNRNSILLVEARDEAFKMTQTPKNKQFTDSLDSDAISTLISDAGLTAEVEDTTYTHPQLLQYQSTDWDFLLSRAQANGQLIIVNDGTVSVGKEDFTSSEVLTLTYGTDIISLDMTSDARSQITSSKTVTWDYSTQAIVESESSEPDLNELGDQTGATLAEAGDGEVRTFSRVGKTEEDELTAWNEGIMLKSRMAAIVGTITFQGNAAPVPGTIVKLDGMGTHFNGSAFISAMSHDFSGGNWLTTIQTGLDDKWFAPENGTSPQSYLLPKIQGVHIGTCIKIGPDDDGEDRIQIYLPMIHADNTEGLWARVSTLDAGLGDGDNTVRGTFFRPEVDDEVLVAFLDGDPRDPVVIGMLHSSSFPAPVTASDDTNHIKGIYTRSDMKLEFDDENKITTLYTPAGNMIQLDEQNEQINIEDQHGNSIVTNEDGITITSIKDIVMKAAENISSTADNGDISETASGDISETASGDISNTATGSVTVSASSDCEITALNITSTADAEYKASGSAGAELSTSAIATISGSLVQIN